MSSTLLWYRDDLRVRFDPHRRHVTGRIPELETPDYPDPVVDLKESRQQALTDYGKLGS